MNHLEFERDGKRYCLTGTVITVFLTNGIKQHQFFFKDTQTARYEFLIIE